MKKLLLVTISLLLFSCRIGKQDDILYIIPNNVLKLLEEKINGNYKNIYFHLSKKSNKYYIYYSYSDKNSKDYHWIKNTTRSLLIDDKLYPLIFDYDEVFGITDSYSEILKQRETNEYPWFSKSMTINDGDYIIFTQKGEIITE